MLNKNSAMLCSAALAAVLALPAQAQEAGEVNIQVAAARTKLVDKGQVFTDGVLDPAADYTTREAIHGVVGMEYFPVDRFSIGASISTPATTNNLPAGSLAGLPNLGDDEFVLATIGGSFYPVTGPVRPYVGGGLQVQITTQERDALAVDLNIPGASGPYVNGGVKVAVGPSFDIFADVRKAWYSTNATGLLPLDATYTNFAEVDAKAVLDPLTIQVGIGTRFGHSGEKEAREVGPRQAGDFSVKLGITHLELADQIDLMVGGAPFPGAGLSTFEHITPTANLGYFLTSNIAVNATIGFPPTIDVYGAGSIGALPKLGKVTYGPTALTVQYHPIAFGRIRPYVGAGMSYMFVFGTKDGAFADLEVSEDLGWAFEAGVDFPVTQKMGMFIDLKKALLRPQATGTFNGLPVVGETKLDPWALTTGVSFTF